MRHRIAAVLAIALLAITVWSPPADAQRRQRGFQARMQRQGGQNHLWPSRGAYFSSMQNPGNLHALLQRGQLLRDRQGMPVVASGSFSSAYRFQFPNGKNVAVRVFHPPPAASDRTNLEVWRQRYALLQKHLDSVRIPPEIVEVRWIDDGVQVNGRSLPVTVMPWIEARSLDAWINTRLGQPEGQEYMRRFAQNWRSAMRDLRGAHLAHGDLHHGNVLIERGTGNMRFIDYDAMWAPTLAGTPNAEIGHPNYQHPSYFVPTPRARPYGPELDNFSALVIYVTAKALQHDPSLWGQFHKNEDHLLFTQEDYLNPASSAVFRAIEASPNQNVRKLARALAGYCQGAPERIPNLDQAVSLATGERPAAAPAAQPAGPRWYQP